MNQNVVTYQTVISVPNPELKLKPGMTANVTFVYAEKDDVLRVPNATLRVRMPEGIIPVKVSTAAPAKEVAATTPGPVAAASAPAAGPERSAPVTIAITTAADGDSVIARTPATS